MSTYRVYLACNFGDQEKFWASGLQWRCPILPYPPTLIFSDARHTTKNTITFLRGLKCCLVSLNTILKSHLEKDELVILKCRCNLISVVDYWDGPLLEPILSHSILWQFISFLCVLYLLIRPLSYYVCQTILCRQSTNPL